jgi:DNA polymerase V
MDIVAKKAPPDQDGVRIAELDERSYREQLWSHRPLKDFWRVGGGSVARLEAMRLFTMGDIARASLLPAREDQLYKAFGVNTELLIDHAWGWEPCTIDAIKAYRPENTSLSVGQVLSTPYPFDKARLIIHEMAESLTLDLVRKGLMTDQMVLTVGYDIQNLKNNSGYSGEVVSDYYGRRVPKHSHGSENLKCHSSSSVEIVQATLRLFDRIVDPALSVRRMVIAANHTAREAELKSNAVQLNLFEEAPKEDDSRQKEREIQHTVLRLQKRYGKNAVLKGMNFKEGATAIERNAQIGGHKA